MPSDSGSGCPDLDSPALDDDLISPPDSDGLAGVAPGATDRGDAALLRLCRVMTAATIRAGNARDASLTATQIRALTLLAAAAGGLSLGAVADCLGSSPSATSRVCSRLVTDGLVTRTAGPGNEIRLCLSGDGRRVLATINEDRLRRIRSLLDRLPSSEREHILTAAELLAVATAADGKDGSTGPEHRSFW